MLQSQWKSGKLYFRLELIEGGPSCLQPRMTSFVSPAVAQSHVFALCSITFEQRYVSYRRQVMTQVDDSCWQSRRGVEIAEAVQLLAVHTP